MLYGEIFLSLAVGCGVIKVNFQSLMLGLDVLVSQNHALSGAGLYTARKANCSANLPQENPVTERKDLSTRFHLTRQGT